MLIGFGQYRLSESFDFAQDDGGAGWQEGIAVTGLWLWLSGAHLFVGGDELPTPGFGEVFEVWVLSADQV